mmetsp:Transcript_26660/g.39603  ORF Transcript_26660/g.39603 Transcript_26660/m.39603 type:complete len:514 (-) Transcript_26660:17-1558(-)
MTTLFATSSEVSKRLHDNNTPSIEKSDHELSTEIQSELSEPANTFADLGLIEWVCNSCRAMGFKRPTPIQQACIKAILDGRNVMGCAETGSGKTAAFALPMLQHLSEDPYGVYGIILTPTRELAVQIEEQVTALGSPIGVRTCLVIGGMGLIDQSIALSRRPHIVIATPGRLRHHLESADPPDLSRSRYLVLDEADRLLSVGFESELRAVIQRMTHRRRQTLLFSATLTSSLEQLEQIASSNGTLRFDLTTNQVLPVSLTQQYLFVPSQVKICFLVAVIKRLYEQEREQSSLDDDDISSKKLKKKVKKSSSSKEDAPASATPPSTSIIIFASSCKRCQLITEVLLQVGIDCVTMHSLLSQSRRAASLGKFKNQACRVLVATDIASRGLDIPQVNLVINLDMPKVATDYVHRVGRTARAGRAGRSLSIVSPQEVDLVHNIEEYTKIKMTLSEEVSNDDVIPFLNPIAKAMKLAELRMMEVGFEEKAELAQKRKRKQLRKEHKKIAKNKKLNGSS